MGSASLSPSSYDEVEEILVDTRDRVRAVQAVIAREDKKYRAKYPFLQHQDTMCILILLLTLLVMLASTLLYMYSFLPWYISSIIIGACIGVHHELEHDIIHNLYFKSKPLVQDILFGILFLTKFHVSPWQRRIYHWKHHRVSGQLNDVEERLVGMGTPLSAKKFFLAVHPTALYTQYAEVYADAPSFDFKTATRDGTVTTLAWQIITKLYMLYVIQAYLNPANPYGILPQFLWPIVKHLMIILIVPNLLRNTSLIVLTTNSHYYKDIPKNSIFYQTQILQHPLLYPFALFTCNFGATHIIHHYNALQPFYLRQLVTSAALEEMRKQGVRYNDWGSMLRANAFHRDKKNASKERFAFILYAVAMVVLSPVWLVLGDIHFLSHYLRDCVLGYSLKTKGQVEDDDYDNTLVKVD